MNKRQMEQTVWSGLDFGKRIGCPKSVLRTKNKIITDGSALLMIKTYYSPILSVFITSLPDFSLRHN